VNSAVVAGADGLWPDYDDGTWPACCRRTQFDMDKVRARLVAERCCFCLIPLVAEALNDRADCWSADLLA
jgi:hypothetical protein